MESETKTRLSSMKLWHIAIALAVLVATFGVFALSTADRIKEKWQRVQTDVNALAIAQIPAEGLFASITEVKEALDANDAARAEQLLDQILARKDVSSAKEIDLTRAKTRLPPPPAIEPVIDAYTVPQLVETAGYNDHSMEPCITPDGKFLMFNSSNAPTADTHIHLLKRVDRNKFQHIGLLPGTVSGSKDMAPSVDGSGNLYFTSLRTYDKDAHSLYAGKFDGARVHDPRVVPGDVSSNIPTWINMDCCVSEDGSTLVVSRARFDLGTHVPTESDLLLFQYQNGLFKQHARSHEVLRAINTRALEYAPSLSSDKLQLFFTRAQDLDSKPRLRIMVAVRKNEMEDFGEPAVIKSIEGFVEAPTLPASGEELFFHKMHSDGKFRIFRCQRK